MQLLHVGLSSPHFIRRFRQAEMRESVQMRKQDRERDSHLDSRSWFASWRLWCPSHRRLQYCCCRLLLLLLLLLQHRLHYLHLHLRFLRCRCEGGFQQTRATRESGLLGQVVAVVDDPTTGLEGSMLQTPCRRHRRRRRREVRRGDGEKWLFSEIPESTIFFFPPKKAKKKKD